MNEGVGLTLVGALILLIIVVRDLMKEDKTMNDKKAADANETKQIQKDKHAREKLLEYKLNSLHAAISSTNFQNRNMNSTDIAKEIHQAYENLHSDHANE